MKPEIPLKSGDEWDAFSSWRRVICSFHNQTGKVRAAQRRYWKRVRQHIKAVLRDHNSKETK